MGPIQSITVGPNGLVIPTPANSGYSGCLQYEVYPWRIYYQLVNPARVILIAIVPHPTQL